MREKRQGNLTADAFSKLLLSFDADWERAGEKYEQVRKGLVYFFQCRGATVPEDHADEAINRVARKLADGEQIRDPHTYVYGVARLILLEVFKQREKERLALVNFSGPTYESPDDQRQADEAETKMHCLRHCLNNLAPDTRHFITSYYTGLKRTKIQNRKQLAEQLQIPLNALRLRARRLREKLEICVGQCLKKQDRTGHAFDHTASSN